MGVTSAGWRLLRGRQWMAPPWPSSRWSVLVNVWSMWSWWGVHQRAEWLRLFGVRLGTGCMVQSCHIGSPRVAFGDRCYIGVGCVFEGRAEVTVGSNVAFGDQVMVITSTHDHRDPRLRAGAASGRSVTIADGCWLASRATVLPGVHVGEGCVIAAGAVVVRDCAPHGLYVGVPARRVRDLPTGD